MSETGSSGHTGPVGPAEGHGQQPGGPDRTPTAPQPSYGQPSANPQQPYGPPAGQQPYGGTPYGQPYARPYTPPPPGSPPPGQPYWGPPRMPTTPVPNASGGLPPGAGPVEPNAVAAPARRSGRLKMGLAGLVAGAARVACGDTGVSHLATATGTPSVTLFGPVAPAEWGPPPLARHVALWAGRRGDPHAGVPDPGLLEIGADEVRAALARL